MREESNVLSRLISLDLTTVNLGRLAPGSYFNSRAQMSDVGKFELIFMS